MRNPGSTVQTLWCGTLSCVAAMLLTTDARAQSPSEIAVAEELFREGQELFGEGKAEQACPKFAASYQIAEGLGTLANLARCYEAVGRTASAWALYVDLKAFAERKEQPDRVAIAVERIAALEPILCKLEIVVGSRAYEMVLKRNGDPVDPAAYGVAFAVDPGKQTIEASAEGYISWSTEIDVQVEGETTQVNVPALERSEAPSVAPPPPLVPSPKLAPAPPTTPKSEPFPWVWTGAVTAGVGVIGLGVAGGFAAGAASDWSDAGCVDGICRTTEAQSLAESANRSATVATGFAVVGGAILAVGGIMVAIGIHDDSTAKVGSLDQQAFMSF